MGLFISFTAVNSFLKTVEIIYCHISYVNPKYRKYHHNGHVLIFDTKIDYCRTHDVNSVIGCIDLLSCDFLDIEKPDFSNLLEKSG